MDRPTEVRIDITTPCSEDWNKMTTCEQGRFCSHCNKEVIDFTTWCDAALYAFFANRPVNVCGRVRASQMRRPIRIPPQPHSRLYRLVVAMGLSLLAIQPTYAQSRPPMKNDSVLVMAEAQDSSMGAVSEFLSGKVLDDKKEPLINASIQVYRNGVLIGGVVTDFDGLYLISLPSPGEYDVLCSFPGYDPIRVTNLTIPAPSRTVRDFAMKQDVRYPRMERMVLGGISYNSDLHMESWDKVSDKELRRVQERAARKAARKDRRKNGGN